MTRKDLATGTKAFYSQMPLTLVKAKQNKSGDWVVFMEASNEGVDQEGERMLKKALESQKDYFLQHGVLSYDHMHKISTDPKYIIGEPVDVTFTRDNRTLVKGKLYQENEIARGIWPNLVSGSTRFGASVGGYILQKGPEGDINRVIWDEVAVTNKPVLDSTLGHVSVIPPKEFAKSLMNKGIFGPNTNVLPVMTERTTSLTNQGASPMGAFNERLLEDWIDGEHLGKELHSVQEAVDLFSNLWASVMMNEIKTHGDVVTWLLTRGYSYPFAEYMSNFIAMKLPKVLEALSIPRSGSISRVA